MVNDGDQDIPSSVADGGASSGGKIWMRVLRYPFLSSLLIGIFAVMVAAVILPSDGPAPHAVSVAVTGGLPAPEPDTAAPDTHAPGAHTEQQQPAAATTEPAPEHEATQDAATVTPKPAVDAAPAIPIVAEAAVVIADAGLNLRVAEEIDKVMPRDTTLAISVYANDPAATAAAFKTSGRDVWLQIAAQSVRGGIDPGPMAVSSSQSTKDNTALLQKQIALADNNIIGIYVPEDADITGGDPDMWRDIALNLIASSMMIMDATPAKVATTLYMQKQESQISAYLKTDVIVSGDMGPAALQKALADAVPIIMNKQQAIIVMNRPTALAVQTLADWVKTLPSKGIRLVPATKFTGLKG